MTQDTDTHPKVPILETLSTTYTNEAFQRGRARHINAARNAGATWREIADSLGITQIAAQRARYVNSPFNRRENNEIEGVPE